MGELTMAAISIRHAFLSIFMKSFQTSCDSKPATCSAGSRCYISPARGIVVILALLTVSMSAQSAANFKKQEPKTPKVEVAAPEANPIKPAEILPSRYVTTEQLPDYVTALSETLTIRKRVTDPFGQYQDPNARPVALPTVAKVKRFAPAQTTPFSDIVRLIKVTTVMPAEKRFLIGTRTITQGDRIPLSFRGKTIKVEVVAVTSSAIDFRNVENGEQASVRLNMLPVGMTPGNDGINAPGMVPDRPDAPINLDAGSL
jgi:hypothetical protein